MEQCLYQKLCLVQWPHTAVNSAIDWMETRRGLVLPVKCGLEVNLSVKVCDEIVSSAGVMGEVWFSFFSF